MKLVFCLLFGMPKYMRNAPPLKDSQLTRTFRSVNKAYCNIDPLKTQAKRVKPQYLYAFKLLILPSLLYFQSMFKLLNGTFKDCEKVIDITVDQDVTIKTMKAKCYAKSVVIAAGIPLLLFLINLFIRSLYPYGSLD